MFMVAIRTNLFATPRGPWVRADAGKELRISEVSWEYTKYFSQVTNVLKIINVHTEASKIFRRACA